MGNNADEITKWLNSTFNWDEAKKENEFYFDIYKKCLEKSYYNPALGSLNNLLYEIIKVYNYLFKEDHPPLDYIDADFVKDMINIFTKIVNDKKENQVYDVYKLIIEIPICNNIYYTIGRLAVYLECIFYPKEAYLNNEYCYCLLINNILNNYVYGKYGDNKCVDKSKFSILDPYLIKMLDLLSEYYDVIRKGEAQDREFCKTINLVVAYFYKEKYDISLFPKVLDYVYNNFDQLCEFFLLNNRDADDIEVEEIYISRIMDACTKDIPIIK